MFVYSSSVSVNDAVNKLHSLDCVKAAPEHIRKVLLNVDFGLEDRFCDAREITHLFPMHLFYSMKNGVEKGYIENTWVKTVQE